MNYPPGMTKQDWRQINGDEHSPRCPMHEDYEHRCWDKAPGHVELRYDAGRSWWAMTIRQGTGYAAFTSFPIEFCPWCGVELSRPDCICDDIQRDGHETAEEIRKEATL